MRFFIISFIVLVSLTMFPELVFAQPGGGGPPPPVPLTGLELLLGAGAIFGAKKLFDVRNKKK